MEEESSGTILQWLGLASERFINKLENYMESLYIEQSDSTPLVQFDPCTNRLILLGESYPENSFNFYSPVIAWLKSALSELTELMLDITITYMNSSSTKCTLDLLDIIEEAHLRGVKTSILWRYDKENPRSYQLAEEFREEVTFPFEIELLKK